MNTDLYISRARTVRFDPPNPDEKAFTQDDVNKIMAEDRRKHQAQIVKIQQTLEETLTSKNLTAQERDTLAQRSEELQRQYETAAQTSARELREKEKSWAQKLADAEKKAAQAVAEKEDVLVTQALTDAAIKNEAFSAAQLVKMHKPNTKLEEIKVTDPETDKVTTKIVSMTTFDDVIDGKPVVNRKPTDEAIARTKQLTAIYGNLFKSGVASGVGASNGVAGTGMTPGPSGKMSNEQIRNLKPHEYNKIRDEHPEYLGLRRPKQKRQ